MSSDEMQQAWMRAQGDAFRLITLAMELEAPLGSPPSDLHLACLDVLAEEGDPQLVLEIMAQTTAIVFRATMGENADAVWRDYALSMVSDDGEIDD